MNWEGVFKPNKNKILVTLLLGIVFVIIHFVNMFSNVSCSALDAKPNQFCIVNNTIANVLFALPLLIDAIFGIGALFPLKPILQLTIFLLIEVLYLYLLAIIIIKIHNKIRKNK